MWLKGTAAVSRLKTIRKAEDATQMTPSGGPRSRLIPRVISSMLLYVKRVYIQTWRTVSVRPQLDVILVTWNGNGKKR